MGRDSRKREGLLATLTCDIVLRNLIAVRSMVKERVTTEICRTAVAMIIAMRRPLWARSV